MNLKYRLIPVLALALFMGPSAFPQNDLAPFSKMSVGIKGSTFILSNFLIF